MARCARLAVGLVAFAASSVLVGVGPAFAGVSLGTGVFFPSPVTVGDSGLPGSVTFRNFSTSPENGGTLTLGSITLVPSCGTLAIGDCPAGSLDPGVFQVSGTATGAVGTACGGTTFSVTTVDASQGKVRFNPTLPVVLGAPGGNDTCTINFTVSVLKMPTLDADSVTPGVQTAQLGFALGTASVNGASSPGSSSSMTTVLPPGSRYMPLTPARILDTRSGPGPVGPGATTLLQVTGAGGVPATGVTAVAMNVTVTNPTAAQSFLTIYPSGQSRPLAANLNFVAGQTVPNLVVVKVGSDGKVAMFNQAGSTDVIADVAGYFSTAGAGGDGRYMAQLPARIADSRNGSGGAFRLSPGQSFDLQVAGRGGVPATGAEAATMNVAVTGTDATSFLTVYPTGEARPLAANLNWTSGLTVSNRAMVKLGAGGKVTIYNNAGSTDVIVDVSGWYTDASGFSSNGAYTALTPARILDTRDGTGGVMGPLGAGANVDVQVTGQGGVPASGVSAVILNVAVTQPAAQGYLTISPTGSARPVVSDLNYAGGETRSNLVVVQVGTGGKINLFTSVGTHVIFDVAGWYS